MAIGLDVLVSRLQAAVTVDGLDYEQTVRDAVAQLGQDCPILTSTTLAVVSGTASYALPADFLFVVELLTLAATDNVLLSTDGLVPVSPSMRTERWYVEGSQIRLEPTPTYSMDRTLRYAAGYALASGAYARLNENGARIALLYAQYLALRASAQAAAPNAWKYSIGDESVDKSGAPSKLVEAADGALKQYQLAVRSMRTFGARGRYDGDGVAV